MGGSPGVTDTKTARIDNKIIHVKPVRWGVHRAVLLELANDHNGLLYSEFRNEEKHAVILIYSKNDPNIKIQDLKTDENRFFDLVDGIKKLDLSALDEIIVKNLTYASERDESKKNGEILEMRQVDGANYKIPVFNENGYSQTEQRNGLPRITVYSNKKVIESFSKVMAKGTDFYEHFYKASGNYKTSAEEDDPKSGYSASF